LAVGIEALYYVSVIFHPDVWFCDIAGHNSKLEMHVKLLLYLFENISGRKTIRRNETVREQWDYICWMLRG